MKASEGENPGYYGDGYFKPDWNENVAGKIGKTKDRIRRGGKLLKGIKRIDLQLIKTFECSNNKI